MAARDSIFEKTTPVPATAEELFRWHLRPGAFARLVPTWRSVEVVGPGEVSEGSRVELRLAIGPFRVRWLAEHRRVEPGRGFEDVQVEGPFSLWEHRHEFLDEGGAALLRDRIRYRLPAGPLGALLGGGRVRRDLERTFGYRHRTTRDDLELHRRYAGRPRLAVAISGAGGLVGSALSAMLTTGGHRVLRLVRGGDGAPDEAAWDPGRGLLEPQKLEGIDAVVHLAGENIAGGRWTAARRERIRRSRVEGTRALVASLAGLDRPPGVFLCASAIGFYGHRPEETLDETGAPGDGFLAEVCRAWEEEARRAEGFGARVAAARLGVVTSPAGGFLSKLLPAFLFGAGGVVGDGRQVVSWVSIDDVAAAFLHLLMTPELEGPVNVTAPEPLTNRELTRVLGRVLRRPTVAPLPAFVARGLFGRMADETLLASSRVVPAKLEASGFVFRHRGFEEAVRHLLGR